MTANRFKLQIAARLVKQYEAGYAAYLEACEEDRKQGYRPHYCEHGKSQWMEYDNICGGCEDGWSMGDPLQRMKLALIEAGVRANQFQRALDAVSTLSTIGVGIDNAQLTAYLTRVCALAS